MKLQALNDEIRKCDKCELKLNPVNQVYVEGYGAKNSIFFIAQNPSDKRDGDKCFASGKMYPIFEKLLNNYDLTREEVYASNIVKCSTINNASPENYVEPCLYWIAKEIDIVKPKLIVTCSSLAKNRFGAEYGKVKINKLFGLDIPIIAIYHPSYCLRGGISEELYLKSLDDANDIIIDIMEDKVRQEENKEKGPLFHHLHCHDEFSIRDSCASVIEYVDVAAQRGLRALSITNHGHIGQILQQSIECKSQGLKPIFGCEVYVNNYRLDESVKEEDIKKFRKNSHLIILAKNEKGLSNLIKITSDAWVNGFYYRPRTDLDFIIKNKEGLIITSACLGSEINQLLEQGEEDKAKKLAKRLKKEFGDDFYIELVFIDFDPQFVGNKKLIKLAQELDIEMVITNDCHYIHNEDSDVHDLLLLLRDDKTISDLENDPDSVWQFDAKDLYFKTYKEIYEHYKEHYSDILSEEEFNKCVYNIDKIVDEVEEIEFDDSFKFPYYIDENETDEQLFEILKKKSILGLMKKIENPSREYYERLNYELDTIREIKFNSFFLVMSDIVNFAKDNDVMVGPGRGSAAGSLVSYCLNITNVDPIKHNLLFERFLSIGRKDLPDIDVDFEPSGRELVKDYIIKRFGQKNTASVGTYAIFRARSVIQDVARTLEVNYNEVRKLVSKMDNDTDDLSWKEIYEIYPEIIEFEKKYPRVIEISKKLRGKVRNISKHAAGVMISNRSIYDSIPIMRKGETILTAWRDGSDYRELTNLGYLKFDILGLNNLAILKDCLMLLKKEEIDIDLDKIPLDDKDALRLAQEAKTEGIFQFDTPLMKNLLAMIKPSTFNDISAVSALGRPGPLSTGMPKLYAERKQTYFEEYIHPELKEILKDTYGIIIYQEQIMLIAQKIAGFSLDEANIFRKALVKYGKGEEYETKRIDEAKSYHDQFIKGGQESGLELNEIEDIWNRIIEFVSYGFNRSHSVSYALISYWELYLKSRYPLHYLCAWLRNIPRGEYKGESKLRTTVYYANREGYKVLPPDVNDSKENFTIVDDSIRFGFTHVKNMGKAIPEIISKQPFESFDDFMERVPRKFANKRVVDSLIMAGAFDRFGERKELFDKFYYVHRKQKSHQFEDWDNKMKIKKEYDILTLVLSEKIFETQKENIQKLGLIPIFDAESNKGYHNILGRVIDIKDKQTKKGKKMAMLRITDDISETELLVWTEPYKKYKDLFEIGNNLGICVLNNENSSKMSISTAKNKENVILL